MLASMKINEKEGKTEVVAPKVSPANGTAVCEKFKLAYYGSLVIDKRYTSCMLPWIVAEIKRKCQKQTLNVVVENTRVTGTLNETFVEHGLISISKCIKLEGKEASTFAYLTKDVKDSGSCSCHVFEAESTAKAGKFLMMLKKALEECKKQHLAKETENTRSDSRFAEKTPREEYCGEQFNVTYVGKLAVSHRRAPPTLIDTSVERFRHHNQQVLLTSKLNSLKAEQAEGKKETVSAEDGEGNKGIESNKREDNQDGETITQEHPHQPAKSLSVDVKQQPVSSEEFELSRPRSVSDGTPTGHGVVGSVQLHVVNHRTRSNRRLSCLSESRNLLMSVSVSSVSFSSSVSGKVLMERKVQEISFCQQGTTEPEHFGFICHDAKSSHYHCYVFRAESKHAVDNVMKSLKQAFNSAWLAVGSTAACESCPLRKLHCLCQALEGHKPADQEITIRHHLMDNVGDAVVEELRKKYQAEAKRRDVVEQNEIMMSLLRHFYEEMQKVHKHSPNGQTVPADTSTKEKPGNKLIAKARRQFGDIFGRSKARNIKSDQEGTSSDEADGKAGTVKVPLTDAQKRKSATTEAPRAMENTTEVKARSRPKRSHRRSYSDISQVFNSPGKANSPSDSREHVSDEETFVVEHPRSDNASNTSTPRKSVSRKQSYRRAIFDSVVTPTKLPKNAEGLVPCSESIPEGEPVHQHKTRGELRALWQKAIMEQRILIRMEKENVKLRAGEGIAKNKRLKLEYEELLPSNNSSTETWNNLLTSEMVVEKQTLEEAVKLGVPKKRRGEIWQFLLKQDMLRNKRVGEQPKAASYKELKEMTSVHQHAILIDCMQSFILKLVPADRNSPCPIEDCVVKKFKFKEDLISIDCVSRREISQNNDRSDVWYGFLFALDIKDCEHGTRSPDRTFPAHPYFSQQVGVGQFALFNLLKVYSNLDPELGYCQGLSFVAGMLLMHLGEEEAFDVLIHLNFNYCLRNQYMPDMAGLRMQFYQYSRLLHDACPSLHDHFENYEVTPTLYAASWFLTLFSSLFPVSFACRVLDLLCLGGLETIFKVAITLVARFEDKILACESLETVVDFLKVDLPKLAVDEQERIVEDALAMEIGDQLLRFEVEYQVFQEEEVNPARIKPLLEKTERLAEENKSLKNRENFLMNELKRYQRREKALLERIKGLEADNKSLRTNEKQDENVEDEDVGSSLSPVNVEEFRNPTDDNTDSFEHIAGADETDDDLDALSCDSPLTIEDSLCNRSTSPDPSQDDSDHKWTKL